MTMVSWYIRSGGSLLSDRLRWCRAMKPCTNACLKVATETKNLFDVCHGKNFL